MTRQFALGDRVSVTVPDPIDPNHHYHGAVDQVVAIRQSPLATHTGDARDDYLYRVAFAADPSREMLFHHYDLAPVWD